MSADLLNKPATARDVKYFRHQNRIVLLLAVFAVVLTILVQQAGQRRDNGRDEALKYQRCDQNAQAAIISNQTNLSTKDVAEKRKLFYAAVEDLLRNTPGVADLPNAKRVIAAAASLQKVANNAVYTPDVPVSDCKRIYPEGFKVTQQIGNVAPTLPSAKKPTGTNPKQPLGR